MSILGFILFLIVAAVCAWIAEYFVPGMIPGGFLTSAIVGIIGAWIGGSLFGHFGPALAGVALFRRFGIGNSCVWIGFAITRIHKSLVNSSWSTEEEK